MFVKNILTRLLCQIQLYQKSKDLLSLKIHVPKNEFELFLFNQANRKDIIDFEIQNKNYLNHVKYFYIAGFKSATDLTFNTSCNSVIFLILFKNFQTTAVDR